MSKQSPTEQLRELRARYERLKTLYQVGNVIHSTLDPEEALSLILEEAVRVMRATSGSVVLINPTTGFLEIHASKGLPENAPETFLRIGEGITGWVARTGQPVRLGEVSDDPRYVKLRESVRSELAVPLEVDGEVRGVLNVDSDRPDAFSVEDQELLEAFSAEAAAVIHNTWLYEQLRLKAQLFESLVKVSRVINSTISLDDALRAVTREACVLMEAKMCSLMMLDPTRGWLELRASHGAGESYLQKPRLRVAESLLGIVVRRHKPITVENVQTSTRYQHTDVAQAEGLVALLSVPLLFGGESIGTLNVYTGEPYKFSDEEIRIATALAELSAIAIEKARLYERIVDAEEELRQKEKLSALGLLAAEVAHEIRNPLTVMKMLYHGLELSFPGDDPRSRDVEIIRSKMDLLNKIVEQILDFARGDEPNFSTVNLNQLVDDVALLTRHKLKQQHIELVRELDSELPSLLADATQLEQAFLNLTLNAVEAMPNGGRLLIRTSVQRNASGEGPDHVRIEFTDNGLGMTKEQRSRAFESVLQTTKRRGTGLGLAIVRRVVELHRGRIEIQSEPDKGANFQILLPV